MENIENLFSRINNNNNKFEPASQVPKRPIYR